jgi:hypothetical protein
MGRNQHTPVTMIRMIARTALTLATVFTLASAHAAEPFKMNKPKSSMERALDRQLNKHLAFPVLAKQDMTGEVTVSFVVNTEGRIEVLNASATNDDLRTYVLGKLAKVDIGSNPEGMWRTSHIRFVFRPEA